MGGWAPVRHWRHLPDTGMILFAMELPPGLFPALSHELRNPLSSVKMAVQALARNPDLTERDRRRLSIAHREVRTLERLLWLVSEAGRDSAPHLEDRSLETLLEEAGSHIQPELDELGVTLQPPAGAGATRLRVDPARTRGVLAPLLLNVARARGPGALELRIEPPTGTLLHLHLDDPRTVLQPGALDAAFIPFAFGPTRTSGLLLPALRTVMQAQGGAAQVLALPGDGVRYVLSFREAGPR